MSLIVRSNPLSTAHQAGGPAGASQKWLWAAIGVLGVSVLALGATLVVQQQHGRGGFAADASAPVAALAAAAPQGARTPESEIIQENAAPAQYRPAQAAINSGAAGRSTPQAPAPRGVYSEQPGMARPVAASQAPVCAVCGHVESVQTVQQAAPATGVGAVAGGVIGGVLGNQVGKGSGRTAATVLGAVGGGYLGHTVEQRTRTTTAYQMRVRMDDGSVRSFTRAQPVAEGTPVRVEGRGFRVDHGGESRSAQPVRVADRQY